MAFKINLAAAPVAAAPEPKAPEPAAEAPAGVPVVDPAAREARLALFFAAPAPSDEEILEEGPSLDLRKTHTLLPPMSRKALAVSAAGLLPQMLRGGLAGHPVEKVLLETRTPAELCAEMRAAFAPLLEAAARAFWAFQDSPSDTAPLVKSIDAAGHHLAALLNASLRMLDAPKARQIASWVESMRSGRGGTLSGKIPGFDRESGPADLPGKLGASIWTSAARLVSDTENIGVPAVKLPGEKPRWTT